MCGIVGYVGRKRAAPILLDGLKKLEYRGYDSAGICTLSKGNFLLKKRSGRVEQLTPLIEGLEGYVGLGHTRWATHGAPSENNAHPHLYGKFALVHNGIIENARELKRELSLQGEEFYSDTDSEVVVHLLVREYRGDVLLTLKSVCKRLKGAYAFGVICADFPDCIFACKRGSPLIVARREDEGFLASDIPAIAQEGLTAFSLEEGDFAVVRESEVEFYDENLIKKEGEIFAFSSKTENPLLGEYQHYMAKEIAEIPHAIEKTVQNFRYLPHYLDICKVLCQTEYIQIIACGTAYHSGLAARFVFEKFARIPTEVRIASEFRYNDEIILPNTVVIAVSQSGETADTLAAAQIAKERGAKLFAVTNVSDCSLARMADYVFPTCAGREIAVAATKSYMAQLCVLYSLVNLLAEQKGNGGCGGLESLSSTAKAAIESSELVRSWAVRFAAAKSVFFLGRGIDYAAALEGSLKLKEISYLPSEGYPAGELKHGTLALVDEDTPVVAIITQRVLAEKTMNAVHEVVARGAKVYLITSFPEYCSYKEVFASVVVPKVEEAFSPISSVCALQKLAYYTALARGNDPDKPRNLAKSVTVE